MATAASAKKPAKKNPLGRVTALGPKEVWQSALLLPKGWDNLTQVFTDFSSPAQMAEQGSVVVRGQLLGTPDVRFQGGPPRMVGKLVDGAGNKVGFVAFGDTREMQAELEANRQNVTLLGRTSLNSGYLWLNSVELVDPRWLGRLRPRYPGKPRVIGPEKVRDRICPLLKESIPKAADWLADAIGEPKDTLSAALGIPGVPLERVLLRAHLPRHPDQGMKAQAMVERLAALAVVREAKGIAAKEEGTPRTPLRLGDFRQFSRKLPFVLTHRQNEAVTEIVRDLASDKPMRRMLSGDVGSGKTAVFAVGAATLVAAGGRVAIMAPGDVLADQLYQNIIGWWPALADQVALVTGSTKSERPLTDYRWLIGTTALLHREVGEIDYVIVDEQHRFSRAQREGLLGPGTHLLEATATCIPRSLALIQYAGLPITRLHQEHVNKEITTHIVHAEKRRPLFEHAKKLISAGHQILVIYPRRENTDDGEGEGRAADDVVTGAKGWERIAPGRVRMASGAQTEAENVSAIQDMKSGEAAVLVSTTVVEVGVDIPHLRAMVVVHPERLGLAALHQLRGRLARAGGKGQVLLYLPEPVKPEALDRLNVLVRETDGFKIAREDLRIRGFGDLALDSSLQSGSGEKYIYGRPLTPQRVEEAMAIEARLTG